MVLILNVPEQNSTWRWINDLPKAVLSSSEDSSLKGLVCCQLLSGHWYSAALVPLNASWIWFEHQQAFGNRERKSCHQLARGCQFSWYATRYIHAHKYWMQRTATSAWTLHWNYRRKSTVRENSSKCHCWCFLWSRIWRNRVNWSVWSLLDHFFHLLSLKAGHRNCGFQTYWNKWLMNLATNNSYSVILYEIKCYPFSIRKWGNFFFHNI